MVNLLKCVNFPTYLRSSVHTQTRRPSAQRVLTEGLRNGVAATRGSHKAAGSRQRVLGFPAPHTASTPVQPLRLVP